MIPTKSRAAVCSETAQATRITGDETSNGPAVSGRSGYTGNLRLYLPPISPCAGLAASPARHEPHLEQEKSATAAARARGRTGTPNRCAHGGSSRNRPPHPGESYWSSKNIVLRTAPKLARQFRTAAPQRCSHWRIEVAKMLCQREGHNVGALGEPWKPKPMYAKTAGKEALSPADRDPGCLRRPSVRYQLALPGACSGPPHAALRLGLHAVPPPSLS